MPARNTRIFLLRQLPKNLLLFSLAIVAFSCNSGEAPVQATRQDSLTDQQRRLPENALKGLVLASGLEIRTMATEPVLRNPTNIDVDERGRIWVTEAYNYRPDINGNPTNSAGDRIMILEDNNEDGIVDTAKVFYQGPEINAPLGVCVLGTKVIISQSPNVWVFYDDNNDDRADRKEILFQGIGGEQHDHGVHAFTFGADGKLYFNFGNEGKQLLDKNGKVVLDQDGEEITSKKYKQGMVFRCNPDGSNVECLAQNFRNPYEVVVDSYGTLWQSDNDDDGNRSTRINYVMQYGNYGFTDEMTGAGWRASRTNEEDSVPLKHWHLNDPGAVPNLLQTFAGSPTGIVLYEGSLLKDAFYGQMIHCDAGNNVVRSYPVQNSGAGYTASINNILSGEKDRWFRPADVCVAPDGSLIVADWYDSGVGGHAAGDQSKGRIYRIAPPDKNYVIAKEDYATPSGAIRALQNPNLSVRYHAWTALQQMGDTARAELEKFWQSSADPRMRARAFWVLVKMQGSDAKAYIQQAIGDKNPDLRITGLRAATQLNNKVIDIIGKLVSDRDVQVRRECALTLHHLKGPEALALWTALARQYDGKDRWYLEALGIGADRQWDAFFAAYKNEVQNPLTTEASQHIIWRARTELALPYLSALALDSKHPLEQRLKYFRAFDFNTGPSKSRYLVKMIEDNRTNDTVLNKLVLHALDIQTVKRSATAQKALMNVLTSVEGTNEYIELTERYEVKSQRDKLLKLALSKPNQGEGRNAAGLLLKLGVTNLVWKILNGADAAMKDSMLIALSRVGSKTSIDMLQTVALSDKYAMPLRKSAAHKIGNSGGGEDRVLEILKARKVPEALIPDVVASVRGAWRGIVRTQAATYLTGNQAKEASAPPPVYAELAAFRPNAETGKKIFNGVCSACHQAKDDGSDFGPKLTEIGSKLPKEALLEAIVHPSKGISFGYEGWQLTLKEGSSLTGIITSKTETDIAIKFPGGTTKELKTADIKSMKELKESMMPEGLHQAMSKQELADLLEYLSGLKKGK